ncbi:MAG: TraR/DksA C4-type zinc finger protein [Chloroflexi bacterium]|nr:TraR/DksA C4-type zinc finger protein [Chloroflexota bacterium]
MQDLRMLFEASAHQHHQHLCPRQVLGVRMGMYAGELLDLELPQDDKRLFAFVETDGCLIDGISSATNCTIGHRTMHVIDYGKTAATFVDTETNRAIRVWPRLESRKRAVRYAPDAPDRWHAQLAAYQVMPANELLSAQQVVLTVSLKAIISKHGLRVVCEQCGEDIINEREVRAEGQILCRACALGAYYSVIGMRNSECGIQNSGDRRKILTPGF